VNLLWLRGVELAWSFAYHAWLDEIVTQQSETSTSRRMKASAGARERIVMSMDKSLKRTSQLTRQRSVLTRAERIAQLIKEERWSDTARPLGLPKVKVARALIKKAKKAAKEEGVEGAAAEGAAAPAAPAAGAKAPAGKAAPAAKPAAGGKAAKPGGK
jgi:small basic protein (TIGR04137 family)